MTLTREDGERIAEKLRAERRSGRRHDRIIIRYEGRRIAQYGLRRSSRESGHDYIPRQLHVSAKQCRELSDCPLSAEGFFEILREKGLLGE